MFIETLGAAAIIASLSLFGVVLLGQTTLAKRAQIYFVPLAVGIFLALVLNELIPETLELSPTWGGVVIGVGFIGFYLLAHLLHRRFHKAGIEDCDKKGGATLLLIGDGVHNIADGVVLAGAFMISPAVGIAAMIGIALHEIPQEIVEFGVLLRAGYTKKQAAVRNLISASSIFLGVIFVYALTEIAESYVWVIAGLAAGNLLYLAASDLLPRIHNDAEYGTTGKKVGLIILGFALMTALLAYSHEQFPHGHDHAEDEHHEDDAHHDESDGHEEDKDAEAAAH
jgi:zinc and cadmium transporter